MKNLRVSDRVRYLQTDLLNPELYLSTGVIQEIVGDKAKVYFPVISNFLTVPFILIEKYES
jgi:hypothetical protein